MTTKRYTADELRDMAKSYDACAPDYHFDEKIAAALRQAADDADDADRWRWLVAENNKSPLHAKYVIAWFDDKHDGYMCTTSGVSCNGVDPLAIVHKIDTARTQEKDRD